MVVSGIAMPVLMFAVARLLDSSAGMHCGRS